MLYGHLCPVFHSPSPLLPHLIFFFPFHVFLSFLNPLPLYSIFKIHFRKSCLSITQSSPLQMLESGSVLSYTPGEWFDHMAVGHYCLFLFLKMDTLQRRTTRSLDWKNWEKISVSLCIFHCVFTWEEGNLVSNPCTNCLVFLFQLSIKTS